MFHEVVMAAADVGVDEFEQTWPRIMGLGRRFTLYASQRDRALQVSEQVNRMRRVGDARDIVIRSGLQTVDTTAASGGLLGHDDFAGGALADFRAVMWLSLDPEKRCVLDQESVLAGRYWTFGGRCAEADFTADTSLVRTVPGCYTAQAMIITDQDNNQITAFHPGAMQQAHDTRVPEGRSDLRIGIVAPDGREAMITHAAQMRAAGIDFIFDPGQGLPMFDATDLERFVSMARWIAVNDYEARMLCDRLGTDPGRLSERAGLDGLVITLGGDGCELWVGGHREHIAPIAAEKVVDPTGCGDAFRAALLYGLERGWPLARCAALGNRLGALKIAQPGPQNHVLDAATRAMLAA